MGTEKSTIIEINGQVYDARTGNLLPSKNKPAVDIAKANTATSAKPAPTQTRHKNRAIDGMPPRTKSHQAVAPVAKPAKTAAKPKPVVNRPAVNSAKRRSQQRPQTLMRRSVTKPKAKPSTAKVQGSVATRSMSGVVARPKLSASNPNSNRQLTAKSVTKSPAISRFGKATEFKPVPKKSTTTAASTTQPTQNSSPASTSSKAYFEKALAGSQSHQPIRSKPKSKFKKLRSSFKKQRSVFVVAASTSVLVIVGAFVLVSNMSSIEVSVANLHAGINANLPKYEPSGFDKDGRVAYKPGKVTIAFRARDNSDRSYKVIQKSSNWNSDALYEGLIASSEKPYKTTQQKGNTIYLYGDSEAAWVSGGMLYKITGNAGLNDQELLNIADSV